MRRSYYVIASVIAALMPFVSGRFETPATGSEVVTFPGWSSTFEGRTLTTLPLSETEKKFATGFPGRIARFSDGEREIIIRWATEATRKMHPASDCFQGLGYSVTPLAAHRDESGALWASFAATKGSERLVVFEESILIPARRGPTLRRGTGRLCVTKAAVRGGRSLSQRNNISEFLLISAPLVPDGGTDGSNPRNACAC